MGTFRRANKHVIGSAMSHIPKIGDASTCLLGEAVSTVRDVVVGAGNVHL
jgi:hypothetical protein